VVQTKKEDVRQSILSAAQTLFEAKGYHGASMTRIAREANVSSANIYVYFASKLDVLFAIYDPWLRARLHRLEAEAQAVPKGRPRVLFILKSLWHDIPAEENCFANNLMQALSTASPDDRYSRDLLRWAEAKVSNIVADALPAGRRKLLEGDSLAHILFMAFDGFAMNHRLHGSSRRIDDSVSKFATILIGQEG
jgi:AcrR family transcriptional regulator